MNDQQPYPHYNLTEELRPPENVELDIISPGGISGRLVFDRNLWWFPDRSMYVYYRPMFWRVPA